MYLGFLFGPAIGRLADRCGRARFTPLGLGVSGVSALFLAPTLPLFVPKVVVIVLSLGYDLTQPLVAGIVTQLSTQRGQAMGLNVCTLFVGFGLGRLLFQACSTSPLITSLLCSSCSVLWLFSPRRLPSRSSPPSGRRHLLRPEDRLQFIEPVGM
ncbi:MAG: MFS transporter [Thaumarchaeota archaeon]|nr:MFS transporter [Nitrososphaerota archaeon]